MSGDSPATAPTDDAALLVDAHLHLWDQAALAYPWMEGRDLPATSLPDDPWEQAPTLEALAPEHVGSRTAAPTPEADPPVRPAAVVVEAGARPDQWDDEVAWVRALAADHPHLRAMVAAVDYTAADLLPRLDAYAADDFVCGVRDNFEGLPSGAIGAPERLAGILAARERGLTVDLCVRASQLDELVSLLTAVAEVRGDAAGIVLDHVGKPDLGDHVKNPNPGDQAGTSDQGDQVGQPGVGSEVGAASGADATWRDGLAALAAIPGVHVKVSGLPGQMSGPVDADDLAWMVRDYATPAIEEFGPERSMFGTDHPVSTLPRGVTRADWARAVVAHAPGAAQVLGATAQRFYGI